MIFTHALRIFVDCMQSTEDLCPMPEDACFKHVRGAAETRVVLDLQSAMIMRLDSRLRSATYTT
jgi:hypothetical protein